jgi:hypothetical protein
MKTLFLKKAFVVTPVPHHEAYVNEQGEAILCGYKTKRYIDRRFTLLRRNPNFIRIFYDNQPFPNSTPIIIERSAATNGYLFFSTKQDGGLMLEASGAYIPDDWFDNDEAQIYFRILPFKHHAT